MKKNFKLFLLLFITLCTVVFINLRVDRSSFTYRVINNDIISYYAYLPAYFIYDDITLKFKDNDPQYFGDKFWADTLANGNYLIRTSMGMSFMYFPFFIGAHSYVKLVGGDANGFSTPYWVGLIISSVFFLLLGLYYLYRFLNFYFSEWASFLSVLLIFFSTNLIAFSTIDAAMSHVFSFSLFSIVLFTTFNWYKTASWKVALLLGFVVGLILLIRPTNIVLLLFVFFMGVTDKATLEARIRFFFKSYLQIGFIALVIFLMWVPQFLYWHTISGKYIINSYDSSGGSFFFNNPQIINQLFHFRKGLLIYTPVLFFAFMGIVLLYFRQRVLFWATLVFVMANIYLLSCWWAWWFGGGFGARGYIDSFPIMAIGLASIIQYLLARGIFLKMVFGAIVSFLIFLNLFQTYQYYKGWIHFVGMTKESYFASFLKFNPPKDYYDNLIIPNYSNAKKGIYFQNEKSVKQSFEENSEEMKLKIFEDEIRNNPVWMEAEAKKAKDKGISIDSMIRIDARWLLSKDNEKD
jgi:hypothetical protein